MSLLQSLRLTGPRLLVRRDEPKTQTDAGLFIPGSAQTQSNKTLQGTVIKIGTGRRSKSGALVPISAAVGDRVHFGFLDGHDLTEDGVEYVILEDSEIQAVLSPLETIPPGTIVSFASTFEGASQPSANQST